MGNTPLKKPKKTSQEGNSKKDKPRQVLFQTEEGHTLTMPSPGTSARTLQESQKIKKDLIDVHARYRGRHGIFASSIHHGKATVDEEEEEEERTEAYSKTAEETKFIVDSLSSDENFLFQALSSDQRQALIDAMERVRVDPDEMIIRRGDEGDYFYLIKEGTIAVYISKDEAFGRDDDDGILDLDRSGMTEEQRKISSHSLKSFKLSIHMGHGQPSSRHSSLKINYPRDALSAIGEDENDGEQFNGASFLESDRHVRDLGPGLVFGELALLYYSPRTASCIAQTSCVLWRVKSKIFQKCMADNSTLDASADLAMRVLRPIPTFSSLDDETLRNFAESMTSITFRSGERIIEKGDVGNTFYVIQEGQVRFHDVGLGDSKQLDSIAGPGEFFGERALVTGDKRAANVTAVSDQVVLLAMGREMFEKRLGPLEDLINRALLKKSLLAVPNISKAELEPYEIEDLLDRFEPVCYPPGHVVAKAGARGDQILVLLTSGKVHVTDEQSGTVSTLRSGDQMGGTTLEHTGPTEDFISRYQVEAVEETNAFVITRQKIEEVVGSLERLGKPLPPAPSKLDDSMTLEHLTKHRILGVGSFGKVWLVQHKKHPDRVYALKVMSKVEVYESDLCEGVIVEKNVLASIDHPLIVNLVAAFQDEHYLYMVQEFLQGGELFTLLHKDESLISEDAAIFYAACMEESLSHLHRRNICYRDLKPENVVLDRHGYCVLIDLGFAKVVVGKTYTMCGSPEYIAPEVIIGRGHNKAADHWGLGCVIYEMLVGQTPFIHKNATQLTLFKRIKKAAFAFPQLEKHGYGVSKSGEDIIRKLLTPNPMDRLGSLAGGEEDIKRHSWFKGILDNDRVVKKEITAPWTPTVEDPLDASNFDSYDDIEEAEKKTKKPPKKLKIAIQKRYEGF